MELFLTLLRYALIFVAGANMVCAIDAAKARQPIGAIVHFIAVCVCTLLAVVVPL